MARVVQIDLRTGEIVATPISTPRTRWRLVQEAFTPDGERLVFVRYHDPIQLRIWDVERMRTVEVIDAPELEEPSGHWSNRMRIDFPPDADQIVTARNNVARWDLAANVAEQVTDEDAWPLQFAGFEQTAPDSGLYIGLDDPSTGYFDRAFPDRVIDVRGRTVLRFEPGARSDHARYTFGPDGRRMFIYRRGLGGDGPSEPFIEVLDLPEGRSQRLPWPEVEAQWDENMFYPLAKPRELWVRHVNGTRWLLAWAEVDERNQLWAYSFDDQSWREVLRPREAGLGRVHITHGNRLWLLMAEEGQPYQSEGHRLNELLESKN